MTPLSKAAQAVELVEGAGYTTQGAAAVLGLPRRTVADIIRGDSGWAERKNRSLFTAYRLAEKSRLEHAMTELCKDSLVHASQQLHKASYYQAVTGSAILLDKVRLLQGEPTQITETIQVHELSGLDRLAAKLGQQLTERMKTIDVTNQSNAISNPVK